MKKNLILILDRPAIVRRWALASVLVAFFAGGCSSSASPTNPSNPSTCVVGQVPTNPECVNPPNLLTVTIKNGVYSPNPVMVPVGDTVNWLNSDTIAHTATDPGVFDTGSIAPTSAADAPVLFNTVGTFNYHCTIHPNETATIIVTGSTAPQRRHE
jgi:plastocyanin